MSVSLFLHSTYLIVSFICFSKSLYVLLLFRQLETTLQTLEDQASNLPQVPQEMISTILELKKDVLSTFHYPGKIYNFDMQERGKNLHYFYFLSAQATWGASNLFTFL